MAANITINSSASYFELRYPMYLTYIIFGTPAILTNLIIIGVIVSEKKLLAKSAMIAGLAGGNLCNGIHAFGYGVYRMPLLFADQLDSPMSLWVCMASLMPTVMVLGAVLPASMQFLIGLERLAAIKAFNWYRVHWSTKKSWYSVGLLYLATVCAWVVPAWYKVFSNYRTITKECSSWAAIDKDFSNMILYVISAGTGGVVLVLLAVIFGHMRFGKLKSGGIVTGEISQFKRQLRLTRMMLVVAVFDIIFVWTPNLLTYLIVFCGVAIPSIVVVYSVVLLCFNSIANIFVFLFLNKEFRRATFGKLRVILNFCRCSSNDVTPLNGAGSSLY